MTRKSHSKMSACGFFCFWCQTSTWDLSGAQGFGPPSLNQPLSTGSAGRIGLCSFDAFVKLPTIADAKNTDQFD